MPETRPRQLSPEGVWGYCPRIPDPCNTSLRDDTGRRLACRGIMRIMNVAMRKPVMTRVEFLVWAEAQETRFEFDGFAPVAMVGNTRDHGRLCQNLWRTLGNRLEGTGCEVLGPDAGVATRGDAVRYPDALITCTNSPGSERLMPGAVAVFEVLSPSSGRVDRIVKLREYLAVPSICRYVLVEYQFAGLTMYARQVAGDGWTASALTADDDLVLPEVGVTIPVAEIYAGIDFSGTTALEI